VIPLEESGRRKTQIKSERFDFWPGSLAIVIEREPLEFEFRAKLDHGKSSVLICVFLR